MSSGEDVANKGSHYYEEEEDNAHVSCLFVEVGPVIKAPSNVHINTDEEERCPVSVHIPD